MKRVVVVDLDGVIAVPREDNDYAKCEVMNGAVEAMTLLHEMAKVVIWTARWEEDREVTTRWLIDKGIPFSKLVLGKPLGDVYIDDRAMRFTSWDETLEAVQWIGKKEGTSGKPMM